ncbi:MAG: PstS family phosphate ABC transporter substrate-binding protein [Pseudonocardia sp.]
MGEFLRRAAEIVSSEPGNITVPLVLTALGLLARLYATRKRLSYKEVYDNRIGIVPAGDRPPDNDARRMLAVFNNVSVVMIRVWNSGRGRIATDDYLQPLRFVVRDRYIVDFRISHPAYEGLRDWVNADGRASPIVPDKGKLPIALTQAGLRGTLPGSLLPENEGGLTAVQKAERRQLRLPPLEMRRGDEFTLVVCLREDMLQPTDEHELTKHYDFGGELRSGKVVDQNTRRRRPSLTTILAGAVAVLTTLLVGSIIWPDPSQQCSGGDLRVVGSSAFAPVVDEISDSYANSCSGARFEIAAIGSLEGIREVRDAQAVDRQRLLAVSDGAAIGPSEQLKRQEIAVLIYALVVNRAAGVQNLTSDQLRQINAGTITNWSQLGGADLAIRMVGRGPDSGSRQAFERYVLRGPEAPVSSNSCSEADRVAGASVIRCERPTTSDLLAEVDRIPGAIGYADASPVAGFGNVLRVRIDGTEPTVEYLQVGYEFWTVEYAYTNGVPPDGALLEKFVGYLSSDAAARRLREEGYVPCVRSDGSIENLCTVTR